MGEMQGRRRPDDTPVGDTEPGDYWRVTKTTMPEGDNPWWIRDPLGQIGRIGKHTVVEHEDGTITVEPSILTTSGQEFHGWLRQGVWTW